MRDDDFYERLGLQVREHRRAKKITQADLAEALDLSRTTMVNIERGRQRLAVHQLVDIARFLGCSPVELIPDQEGGANLTDKQQGKLRDDVERQFIDTVAAQGRRNR